MATERVIETILKQLGGRQFILMTGTKFSYGVDCKQQQYLCCLLPENLDTKSGINRFIITYNHVLDLYQITLAQHHYNEYKIIKIFDDVYASDLVTVFERETGVCCTLTALI